MKRTKGTDSSMGNRDASYTNLAAMVANLENQQLRTVGSSGGSSSTEVVTLERQLSMRQQALELIRKATMVEKQLDWITANQYYFQAANLYQQALEAAEPGPLTDEMQSDLDQLHSHMQNISADQGLISRSGSEGQITSATPSTPGAFISRGDDDGSLKKPAASVETYRNFFDCSALNQLPYGIRDAVQLTNDAFEQLVRQFGFQYSSMRNQQVGRALTFAAAAAADGSSSSRRRQQQQQQQETAADGSRAKQRTAAAAAAAAAAVAAAAAARLHPDLSSWTYTPHLHFSLPSRAVRHRSTWQCCLPTPPRTTTAAT